jgi:hypothetical protein
VLRPLRPKASELLSSEKKRSGEATTEPTMRNSGIYVGSPADRGLLMRGFFAIKRSRQERNEEGERRMLPASFFEEALVVWRAVTRENQAP